MSADEPKRAKDDIVVRTIPHEPGTHYLSHVLPATLERSMVTYAEVCPSCGTLLTFALPVESGALHTDDVEGMLDFLAHFAEGVDALRREHQQDAADKLLKRNGGDVNLN